MKAKRYKIIIPFKNRYSGSAVLGLLKGMAKGQAVVREFYEQEGYVIVRVKFGLEDFFVGQIRSFGWQVVEI